MCEHNEVRELEVIKNKGVGIVKESGMKYVYWIFLVGLSVYMAVNYSGWWLLLLFLG